MDGASLEDLFAPWARVSVRRMFGGLGIYRDGLMIALVADGTLYLKAGDTARAAFEAAGGRPFVYESKQQRQVNLGYYTPPAAFFDDEDTLREWADRAFAAAVAAAALKPPRARRG